MTGVVTSVVRKVVVTSEWVCDKSCYIKFRSVKGVVTSDLDCLRRQLLRQSGSVKGVVTPEWVCERSCYVRMGGCLKSVITSEWV